MKRFIFLSLLILVWQAMPAQCTAPVVTASGPTTFCTGSVVLSTPVAGNSWARKADLGGAARYGATSFSIGSKGYIGTGVTGNGNVKDFWEYDPSTNTWTQKADFGGSARYGATGFSIGGKGYIGTGVTGNSNVRDFWEYNPVLNAWTKKADFGGVARELATGFSIGSKGYIGTGFVGSNVFAKDFWEYDPLTDIWTQKADVGNAERYAAVGFSIGNKGYIGTGQVAFNGGSYLAKDFWEYNPASNTWNQKADFGGAGRNFATSFSIGTKGYIGTGRVSTSTKDFWEYNPSANVWTQKPDFGGTARDIATSFSIGAKGYIGTGLSASVKYNDFWEYDAGYSYSWSPGGQTISSITVNATGSYTVTATNALGCSATSAAVSVFINPPAVLYVDSSVATSGDGSNWANAVKELRDALSAAAQCSNVSSILVAKGTYKSTNDSNRDSAFTILRGGLKIYGGYPTGGGTRNITANPTILSGNIGAAANTDNSYHVVVIAGLASSADSVVLDGFTVRDGYADGSSTKLFNGIAIQQSRAGSIYLHTNANNGKITIRNCVFTACTAAGDGGGFYNENSSPIISKCTFTGNTAANAGAMYNYASSPAILNCIFSGNSTQIDVNAEGGGIGNYASSPIITGCIFTGNNSYRGGGVANRASSSPKFNNCIFTGNTAYFGGAVHNYYSCYPDFNNTTLVYNTTYHQGGAIYIGGNSIAHLQNCIVYNNDLYVDDPPYSSFVVSYSLLLGYSGSGNINANPLFVNEADPDGADNIFGTADDGLRLQSTSPGINTGQNALVPASLTTDITGAARIQQIWVDMGAYESSYSNCNPSISKVIYVDNSVAVSGSGDSWGTAFKELRDAMKAANQCTVIDTILVAKGTYKPTNDANRDSAFTFLNGGFKIFGGYPTGGGTRNIAANPTILSGNIGTAASTDNSYHVVVIAGLGGSSDSLVLDGVTISGGYANGSATKLYNGETFYQTEGAGMCISSSNGSGGKIALRNCSFIADTADANGGALYNRASSPTISNCGFTNNYAGGGGGSIFNNNYASPAISRCTFNTSRAGKGGGIYNYSYSSPLISNTVFTGNTTVGRGGAVYSEDNSSPSFNSDVFNVNNADDGGAVAAYFYAPSTLANCVFVQNSAGSGGGAIATINNCPTTITNCTFTANNAIYGGGMYNYSSSNATISNSIFWGNTGTNPLFYNSNSVVQINNSIVQGGYAGTGNYNTNPLFVNPADPDGADNIFGTSDDGLQLQVSSPAINVGSNTAAAGIATDITGAARIQGFVVDMGAYENNAVILPLTLLQFAGKGIGTDAQLTWRTANEVNVSHFELQRSGDGRSFNALTTVQAKGTAQSETDYNYTDKDLPAGVYYYRLRMVDKDGKETYSAVVTVVLKSSNAITLYPVPAKESVWLSGSAAILPGTNALLMDVQGRVLQSIRISQWPQRIDVSNLAAGTYLVKVEGVKAISFIKQ